MAGDLERLVAEELAQPVDPRVAALATAIAARHGAASRAVLFYGSCLREKQLDGLMLDFYLIVSDYRAAYRKLWMATANRLVPPNVFPFTHDGLAAKYAVLSDADFARKYKGAAKSDWKADGYEGLKPPWFEDDDVLVCESWHREIVKKRTQIMGRVRATYVHRHVDVIKGAKCRAFSQAARKLNALQRKIRVLPDIAFQPFAQAPCLSTVFVCLVFRQIDSFVCEFDNIAVINMDAGHQISL